MPNVLINRKIVLAPKKIPIVFDATTYGSYASATSLTFAHTCTGSNRILFVGIQADYSDVITGVTYAGVSMTKIGVGIATSGGRYIYLFYLIKPAIGANNVVISASGSVFIQGLASSYTGANQSTQPDSISSNSVTAVTSLTATTVTVSGNCWLVMFGEIYAGASGPTVAGTGTIRRATDTDFFSCAMFDSGDSVNIGSKSLQFTWTSSINAVGIIASIKPGQV